MRLTFGDEFTAALNIAAGDGGDFAIAAVKTCAPVFPRDARGTDDSKTEFFHKCFRSTEHCSTRLFRNLFAEQCSAFRRLRARVPKSRRLSPDCCQRRANTRRAVRFFPS